MSELLSLTVAGTAGVCLGAIFFGGLWWTVARGLQARNPALWFVASKLLRTAIVLAGFYLAGGDRWARWTACLLGFVLARVLVGRLARRPAHSPAAPGPEARYAP